MTLVSDLSSPKITGWCSRSQPFKKWCSDPWAIGFSREVHTPASQRGPGAGRDRFLEPGTSRADRFSNPRPDRTNAFMHDPRCSFLHVFLASLPVSKNKRQRFYKAVELPVHQDIGPARSNVSSIQAHGGETG